MFRLIALRSTCRPLAWSILIACAISPLQAPAQKPIYKTITIHNDTPRLDTNGNIVDAHDGNLQFFNGRYYLYGTAYGKTAGFSINNRFRVYSSPDLERWTYEGELLKAPAEGVYYRPYVVYNAHTHKYVLWYNWYPKLWNGQVGVATSDTPVGPFTVVKPNVQLSEAANKPGDGSLFVDRDDTAYFIYTAISHGHTIRVERLTSDYLSSTGQVSPILGEHCEAPVLFRQSNTYYALFDSTCCFCSAGSGARVYKSSSPLGPYTPLPNINRDATNIPIIHAQQTFVATIPTADGPALMWMADRWGSRSDGIKGHDLQYWSPMLRFTANGAIEHLVDTRQWSLAIRVGTASRPPQHPYSWPKKPDPNPVVIDPCTGKPLKPIETGAVLSAE